jgi:hypothetical protein
MGRELRRVPLDFDAPLKKVWKGYVNPHYRPCPQCNGRGETRSYQFFSSWVRLLVMGADESRLNTPECLAHFAKNGRIYPHPYLRSPGLWITDGTELGDQLWDLVERLSGRPLNPSPFEGCSTGLGSSEAWRVGESILKAAGLDPEAWGSCPMCEGEGVHPDHREAHDAWKAEEPPTGEGYQLWETTSEGSPVSPVFASLDALCEWAEVNATVHGDVRTSAARWKEMLEKSFVYHREGDCIFL